MRVAHVIRRFTFEEWGGTENVVWHTARALRNRGVDAEILATAALSHPGDEVIEGVPVRRYPYCYPYLGLTSDGRAALDKKGGNPWSRALKKALIRGRYDLIHAHSGGRIAGIALEAARACGIPCCVSLHGGYSEVPAAELEKMLRPVKGKLHYGGLWERLTGRRRDPVAEMDAVFCVGRNEYDALLRRGGKQAVRLLPNGVDVDRFRAEAGDGEEIRREYGIPPSRRVLLCVSRIDYQKNQLLLVGLLASLARRGDDVHLLLVGPVTSEWYCEQIFAAAGAAGVADRLTLIPGLRPDDPRLAAAYRAGDVFILPSLHEPFGIVVLEAWSAGIPVLASRVGGLGTLVRDGESGLLFDPAEPAALAEAYDRLAGDGALRERIVAGARLAVREYSWDAMAEKLLQTYRELLPDEG